MTTTNFYKHIETMATLPKNTSHVYLNLNHLKTRDHHKIKLTQFRTKTDPSSFNGEVKLMGLLSNPDIIHTFFTRDNFVNTNTISSLINKLKGQLQTNAKNSLPFMIQYPDIYLTPMSNAEAKVTLVLPPRTEFCSSEEIVWTMLGFSPSQYNSKLWDKKKCYYIDNLGYETKRLDSEVSVLKLSGLKDTRDALVMIQIPEEEKQKEEIDRLDALGQINFKVAYITSRMGITVTNDYDIRDPQEFADTLREAITMLMTTVNYKDDFLQLENLNYKFRLTFKPALLRRGGRTARMILYFNQPLAAALGNTSQITFSMDEKKVFKLPLSGLDDAFWNLAPYTVTTLSHKIDNNDEIYVEKRGSKSKFCFIEKDEIQSNLLELEPHGDRICLEFLNSYLQPVKLYKDIDMFFGFDLM